MVLDNVGDLGLVQKHAVTSPYGAFLITSRQAIVTSDIVGIPVMPFDPNEGGAFLCKRSNRNDLRSEDEQEAAKTVSAQFGGLPVALNLAAIQLANYNASFTSFLKKHQRNSMSSLARLDEKNLSPFYDFSLTGPTSLFRDSFDELKKMSMRPQRDLFAILCLVDPDNVPKELFLGLDLEGDPQSNLEFCEDDDRQVSPKERNGDMESKRQSC